MTDAAPSVENVACALCGTQVPASTTQFVNGHATCPSCLAKVQAEIAGQKGTMLELPMALTGALAGAVAGAAVWAAIVVFTNFEVGYVAVLVGFLAGHGCKLGAGKARGQHLQIAAGVASVLGLVVAKYLIFAHFVRQQVMGDGATDVSWFDSFILEAFPGALAEMASPFDLLWIVLAVAAAYRVPAASTVTIQQR
jgi:hypothetical protein